MSQQQKSYLLPIVMMFALFAMISFVTGLPAPFGVIVQSEFGATNLEATLGNSLRTSLPMHLWVFLRDFCYRKSVIRKQH